MDWFDCLSVYAHLVFLFSPFHCTVCPLDAQYLTAALVAVEDLDLRLEQSSIEAEEELFFIPTLRRLTLNLPPEGDACLARWIPNCPQLKELRVRCNSKGEEECI